MRLPRPLPYVAGLVLLAWLLSTIASSRAGGGLLINSTWLYYLTYLAPAVPVGIMFVMLYFVISSLRSVSLPTRRKGTAKKGRVKKVMKEAYFSPTRSILLLGASTIAMALFIYNCNPIVHWGPDAGAPLYCLKLSVVTDFLGGARWFPQHSDSDPGSNGPFQGVVFAFSRVVASPWFQITFVSLVAVSSVITARSLMMSDTNTRKQPSTIFQESGLKAVNQAIKVVKAHDKSNPRTMILECYQHIIKAASQLGASVAPNQTARELELELRETFRLQGPSIGALTKLFEEARYSLHPMTEANCQQAYEYLVAVEIELRQSFNGT